MERSSSRPESESRRVMSGIRAVSVRTTEMEGKLQASIPSAILVSSSVSLTSEMIDTSMSDLSPSRARGIEPYTSSTACG